MYSPVKLCSEMDQYLLPTVRPSTTVFVLAKEAPRRGYFRFFRINPCFQVTFQIFDMYSRFIQSYSCCLLVKLTFSHSVFMYRTVSSNSVKHVRLVQRLVSSFKLNFSALVTDWANDVSLQLLTNSNDRMQLDVTNIKQNTEDSIQ